MRLSYIANAIGLILIYISLVILAPVIVALIYKEYASILPFVSASLISSVMGVSLRRFVKNASCIDSLNDIKKAEALFIVAFSWFLVGIIGAVPYLYYGLTPLNALFESSSGITATGATIFTHFNYPNALFFWRSMTQWLGGLGIIVLFIAILPQFAVAGRQMFFAETPGPTEEKLTPRIKNTASALWKVYVGITCLCTLSFYLAGMDLFDAICNAFSTQSAGGFCPNKSSIMGYNSVPIMWITIIFMFFAGASFTLQAKVITKKNPLLLFQSEEFRTYTKVILILTLVICTVLVAQNNYNIFDGITHSLYQVISISTSTGSVSTNYGDWNLTAKILLFIAMFTGSCAGSAGAGIKMTRWILVFKTMKNELVRILHPNAVLNIKIDNHPIASDVTRQVVTYVFFYFIIIGIFAITMSILEQDYVLGATASISALGNIGPIFGSKIGALGNYDVLHPISKSLYILGMYVGRLELVPFLVLFQKDFWALKRT